MNPTAIPDAVAYGHFIRATAGSATSTDVARRTALLTEAGLSTAEQVVFTAALGDVGHELQTLQEQRRPADIAAMQALQQRQVQVLADAEQRLRAELAPAALAKLDAYIQEHVKRRIRIYQGFMQ